VITALAEDQEAIPEDGDAVLLERAGDEGGADGDVVVAEDGVHLRAVERLEDLGASVGGVVGGDKGEGAAGDEISGEENEVGGEGVDTLDDLLEEVGLGVFVEVDVAELGDAQAVKGCGEVADGDGVVGGIDLVTGDLAGVDGEAGGEGGGTGEEGPAGDGRGGRRRACWHGLIILGAAGEGQGSKERRDRETGQKARKKGKADTGGQVTTGVTTPNVKNRTQVRREPGKERVRVLCSEGIANHTGPESCVVHREVQGEALTGETVGQPLSRESDKSEAASGVDGATWQSYKQDLEVNLTRLHEQVHRGTYRALPSRRRYIPKPDGRQRPLGIVALEDKIVQRATMQVLNAIYEEDFLGFSYGFRPGREQHDALDALAVGITTTKVNWIVDADIAGYFDAVSHEWLMHFVEHRVGDRRILRLIRKWLKAGVMEDGKLVRTEAGTPQGAVISPLLANIYLHYAFDLWAD